MQTGKNQEEDLNLSMKNTYEAYAEWINKRF
jgi:hypothetical protein